MSNDYIKKVLSAGLNINKNRLNEELGNFSGGGSGNAIQYTEQNLTEEQRLQVKKNLGLQYYTTKEISYNRTPNSGVYVEINGNKYYKISNDTFSLGAFLTTKIFFNDPSDTGREAYIEIIDDSDESMAFCYNADLPEELQTVAFFLRGGKDLGEFGFNEEVTTIIPEDGVYINNCYLQGVIEMDFFDNCEQKMASTNLYTQAITFNEFPQSQFTGSVQIKHSMDEGIPNSVIVEGRMCFPKDGIIIQSSNGPSLFILTVNESGQLSTTRCFGGEEEGDVPQ